jgi:hypothetical protein
MGRVKLLILGTGSMQVLLAGYIFGSGIIWQMGFPPFAVYQKLYHLVFYVFGVAALYPAYKTFTSNFQKDDVYFGFTLLAGIITFLAAGLVAVASWLEDGWLFDWTMWWSLFGMLLVCVSLIVSSFTRTSSIKSIAKEIIDEN